VSASNNTSNTKYGQLTDKNWPPGIYTNLPEPVIVRNINQIGLAQITPLLTKVSLALLSKVNPSGFREDFF
jgi:hypothetical protein